MASLLVSLGVVVASAVSLVLPAHAHDHVGPDAVLVSGEIRQVGRSYHGDWIRPTRDGRACLLSGGSGTLNVPRGVGHGLNQAVVVRLEKSAAPREVQVLRWPRVDDRGMVTGEPTPVPFVLEPHVVRGVVRAWNVVIPPIMQADHVYLDVAAWWADEEGCTQQPDLGSQYKAWLFHFKTVA